MNGAPQPESEQQMTEAKVMQAVAAFRKSIGEMEECKDIADALANAANGKPVLDSRIPSAIRIIEAIRAKLSLLEEELHGFLVSNEVRKIPVEALYDAMYWVAARGQYIKNTGPRVGFEVDEEMSKKVRAELKALGILQ